MYSYTEEGKERKTTLQGKGKENNGRKAPRHGKAKETKGRNGMELNIFAAPEA